MPLESDHYTTSDVLPNEESNDIPKIHFKKDLFIPATSVLEYEHEGNSRKDNNDLYHTKQ